MKKQLIFLVLIFILGFTIFIGMYVLGREKGSQPSQQTSMPLGDEVISQISSSEKIDLTQKENEQFDENQLYFEDAERLYDFFTVLDAEIIKSKASDYILTQDSMSGIKDAKIDSIQKESDTVVIVISASTSKFKLLVELDKGSSKSMVIERTTTK